MSESNETGILKREDLPLDLFNPDRMPARDEDGYVCHPDYDLIHEKIDADDEGQAATEFIKKLGYEFLCIDFYDDATVDQHNEYEINCAVTGWEPRKPRGEGWQLFSIYQHDDGVAAAYIRVKK